MTLRTLFVLVILAVPLLAQAECGWLLMLPPYSTAAHDARPSAPIVQWGQAQAFDTALECEKNLALSWTRLSQEARAEPTNEGARRLAAQYGDARCLPAGLVPVR